MPVLVLARASWRYKALVGELFQRALRGQMAW